MAFYSQASIAELVGQINRDNPDLEGLTPDGIVLLSAPLTTELGTSGRNTRIRINGRVGVGFIGKREVFYDRLDLGKLYSAIPPGLVLPITGDVGTFSQLLPVINAAFGLGLTATDLKKPTAVLPTAYTPTAVTLEIDAATSLIYTGKIVFKIKRTASGTYEDSGPGNKVMLAGTIECGYFGKVTTAELLDAPGFFSKVFDDTSGPGNILGTNDRPLFWYKFALNGKYLFFPSRHIASNATWGDLYNLGAVYGDDSTGSYPPSGATPTPQSATVCVDADNTTYALRVRLPRYSDTDPQAAARGDVTSEAEQLFNKLHAGLYGTGVWEQLANSAEGLDISQSFWWINSLLGDVTKAHHTQANLGTLAQQLKTATGYWRPMLELIPAGDRALAAKDLRYSYSGVPNPPRTIQLEAFTDGNTLLNVTALQYGVSGVPSPIRALNAEFIVDANSLFAANSIQYAASGLPYNFRDCQVGYITDAGSLYGLTTLQYNSTQHSAIRAGVVTTANEVVQLTEFSQISIAPRVPVVTLSYEV